MSLYYPNYAIQMKNMPRIDDRQFKLILNNYGFNVILRKRVPIATNPVPCPCVAEDDIFNRINPDCPLCGGTGILGGDALRDQTIKILMQPSNSMGMMGVEVTYTYATKMERVQETCYVAGDIPVDLGDFIIDTYDAPEGGTTVVEYEVFDKEIWRVGLGPNRKRRVIYQKIQIRKTEYAKTVSTEESY
ncbi:MAG: hypothetical protein DRP09_12170 [Candidatus Thorarchaeota archaeon]|nr:MAG: hypothetical protein DRP09_12170 [Candidatus Thorarchaeota archaeon]